MKHHSQNGFTLIEMLSVLAIFSILTAVVVFNYTKFRSDTILTNMAYEVALSIREAQIYGISARRGGPADYSIPYGIFLTKDSETYSLFADTGSDTNTTPDGIFSGTGCGTLMDSGFDTCVTTYSLQRGVKIRFLKINKGSSSCLPASADNVSILFKRPNPEPILASVPSETPISFVQIVVEAPDGATRYVLVYNNGQVTVTNNDQCN